MYGRDNNHTFIENAGKVHEEKYNYSKATYINSRTKICIICPIHGEFWQTPSSHLSGSGCPKCAKEKASRRKKLCTEEFIKKAKTVHHDKYDYARVKYKDCRTNVCIICPKHGEFWQMPYKHLQGHGCPECGSPVQLTKEMFINKAKRTHGDKYDYSKVKYCGCDIKVCIICSKHGDFWQTPSSHLQGKGCPVCNFSHLERETMTQLCKNNIDYETQKRFKWLRTDKRQMSLDFFLPAFQVAIECQGIQHYKSRGFFSENKLIKIRQNDKLKRELCQKHNIKIYYIKYNDDVVEKIKKIVQMCVYLKKTK